MAHAKRSCQPGKSKSGVALPRILIPTLAKSARVGQPQIEIPPGKKVGQPPRHDGYAVFELEARLLTGAGRTPRRQTRRRPRSPGPPRIRCPRQGLSPDCPPGLRISAGRPLESSWCPILPRFLRRVGLAGCPTRRGARCVGHPAIAVSSLRGPAGLERGISHVPWKIYSESSTSLHGTQ